MRLISCLIFFITSQFIFEGIDIVECSDAAPKRFPYQVGLRIYEKRGNKNVTNWCSGAIIGERWILTAAQCLDKVNIFGVDAYLGTIDYNNTAEAGQQQIFIPRKYFVIHEDFYSELHLNDIALIRLPAAMEFDDFIASIALPANRNETFVERRGVISGWGRLMHHAKNSNTTKLQYESVSILSNSKCKTLWHENKVNRTKFFSSSYLCAAIHAESVAVITDNGGPLVVLDLNMERIVVGLASFGLGYAKNVTQIYTRLTEHLDWIEEKIKPREDFSISQLKLVYLSKSEL